MIIISCFCVGNWFSLRLTQRVKYLCGIISSISKAKTLMTFSSIEALSVMGESFGRDDLLSVHFKSGSFENFKDLWDSFVSSVASDKVLYDDDIKLLRDFGREFGTSDTNGQVLNCDMYIKFFEEQLISAKEEQLSKSRLYRVLGLSLGCVVGLVVL